jgi:hypothetical protein
MVDGGIGAMSRRALWVGLALVAMAASCGEHDRPVARQDRAAAPSQRPTGCPVTSPNHNIPLGQSANPGADRAPYHGNDRLWTVLPDNGIIRVAPQRDGLLG